MDLGLGGRVVAITGGSDGLGSASAELVLAEGGHVAICGRDRERLHAARDRLARGGGEVLAVQADVTAAGEVEAFIDAAIDRWGRLDGVVNNAGAHASGQFASVSDEAWRADLELKLLAAVRCCRHALAHERGVAADGGGAIVNVLNVYAKAPDARTMPTSVSRAAGLALTKALAREFAPAGVRVNAAVVGFIESSQWTRLAEQTGKPVEQLHTEMVEQLDVPIGRIGRAAEFADVVAFLLSERSSYVSGTAINVDGGLCPVV